MPVSSCIELTRSEQQRLLAIADAAIEGELQGRPAPAPLLERLPSALRVPRGVFVTLRQQRKLRGCIGSLEASQPLALATADMARAAALRDTRFAPVQAHERFGLTIEISVLSALTPLRAEDRDELLQRLSPGEDGLLLEERCRQATFLPQVWRQLPQPEAFWEHLLAKAGLPPGYWSPGLRLFTYQARSFTSG